MAQATGTSEARGQEALDAVLGFYRIDDLVTVPTFLAERPGLLALLRRGVDLIPEIYGEGFEPSLFVDTDLDTGRPHLMLVVATGRPFEERHDLEQRLDEAWPVLEALRWADEFHHTTR